MTYRHRNQHRRWHAPGVIGVRHYKEIRPSNVGFFEWLRYKVVHFLTYGPRVM